MRTSEKLLHFVAILLMLATVALTAETWYEQDCKTNIAGEQITLTGRVSKSCGQSEDCNGGCGTLQNVVPIQKSAACRRFCTDIPSGKKVASVTVFAKESDSAEYSSCGGACGIQWSGYFGDEWYKDKRRFCTKLKNWSADRDRDFKVVIGLANE